VDWSANALRRNAQPPSQSSWSSSIRFAVKRAVSEFWSVFFYSNDPWKVRARFMAMHQNRPVWAIGSSWGNRL